MEICKEATERVPKVKKKDNTVLQCKLQATSMNASLFICEFTDNCSYLEKINDKSHVSVFQQEINYLETSEPHYQQLGASLDNSIKMIFRRPYHLKQPCSLD